MGSTTDAGCVDPGRHAALREHVGAGLNENALLLAQALPCFSAEVCCDECVGALEGTDPACMQIWPVEQKSDNREANSRNHCRSVEVH